jgi:histidine triad (HIT) family protein
MTVGRARFGLRSGSAGEKQHMRDQECTFCRIVAREMPAYIIDENDQVIVFLSLENHPMVVPREHIPDIYAMPSDVGAAVMEETIKVARAVKKALQCDGVYLTQANEPAAGQDVFHYHLHVYPCWGDRVKRAISDFVGSVTDRENVTEEMKAATAEKVRQGLANL